MKLCVTALFQELGSSSDYPLQVKLAPLMPLVGLQVRSISDVTRMFRNVRGAEADLLMIAFYKQNVNQKIKNLLSCQDNGHAAIKAYLIEFVCGIGLHQDTFSLVWEYSKPIEAIASQALQLYDGMTA